MIKRWTLCRAMAGLAAAALAATIGLAPAEAAPTKLTFYFPIAVGGPITKIIDGYVAGFEKANPDIQVNAIYAGSYTDTITKALTAMKGGDAPQVAVLLSTDVFTLMDENAIVPVSDLARSPADKKFLKAFYPAFMANSTVDGKIWGVPFQRSTIVMYYNKAAFKDAGLNPDKPPATWAELAADATKLTKRDGGGNVSRWGIEIPGSGFTYWLFQALVTENGGTLANQAGTETYFDKPAVVQALQYWVDLSTKDKAHPTGIVEWGTAPKDFLEGKAAIMWTTTGNLTNVRKNATFPFGIAMLPAQKRRGTPTGGGNFYIFKNASPAQRAAALRFVEWMTSPERAAQWGIDTGYIAVRPDAWQTPAMKTYVAGFPDAAVARDQLQYAVAEFSTHENQRVVKVFDDALQAALTGAKPPKAALTEAQAQVTRILKPYR